MKKLLFFLCVITLILGLVGTTNATLWDRGGGLVYDDVLDITWLQDVNYAMTSGYDSDGLMNWQETTQWVHQLVYAGYDNWRLPTANNKGTGEVLGGHDRDTELGHMYYNNLANTQFYTTPNAIS